MVDEGMDVMDPSVDDEAKLSVLDEIQALMDSLEGKKLEASIKLSRKGGGEEDEKDGEEDERDGEKPEGAAGDDDLAKLAAISKE